MFGFFLVFWECLECLAFLVFFDVLLFFVHLMHGSPLVFRYLGVGLKDLILASSDFSGETSHKPYMGINVTILLTIATLKNVTVCIPEPSRSVADFHLPGR